MKNVTLSKTEFKNIKDITNPTVLQAFYQSALINNFPVAFWKMPNNDSLFCLVSFTDIQKQALNFSEQKPSFVFSPFINNDSKVNYIISQDIMINLTNKEITIDSDIDPIKMDSFINSFNNFIDNPELISKKWFISENNYQDKSYNKEEFCGLVKETVSNIKSTKTKKIVVSRKFNLPLSEKFDLLEVFNKLAKKYENAFVSVVSIPKLGTWIGATPETLLKIENNEITTMSLAGTQKKPDDNKLENIKWGEKEIEEQRFVSEYIRDCFISSGADNFIEEKPKTADAGKVVHLRTIFRYKSENAKKIAGNFLKLMHPTPAVCGLPKKEALAFLIEHEFHKREFYSGFLGPVNINGMSALFVNLRCMQLKNQEAVIYVGCGITGDSQPEKEWEETQLKAQTLLSVIDNE